MKYQIDHDYHIHSQVSSCSSDLEQTTERILQYAKDNGLKKIVVTDHYWDTHVPNRNPFYDGQNNKIAASALPLPKADGIEFLLGCETDMDEDGNIGICEACTDQFDFIIVPTTHMHMYHPKTNDFESHVRFWIERYEKLLDSNLPFHKVGIAHMTCDAIGNPSFGYLHVLDAIEDRQFEGLFRETARKGMGVELNACAFVYSGKDIDRVFRPYRIAKECGCKFYLGSDAHHPADFSAYNHFQFIIDTLDLQESDKFHF